MSMSPHTVHNHRWGLKYGQELKLVDSLAASLEDQNTGRGDPTPMGSESDLAISVYILLKRNAGLTNILHHSYGREPRGEI